MYSYDHRKYQTVRQLGLCIDLTIQLILVIISNTVNKSRFGCLAASLLTHIAAFVSVYLHIERRYKFGDKDYFGLIFVFDFLVFALFIIFVCIWSLTPKKHQAEDVFIAYLVCDVLMMVMHIYYHVHEGVDESKWRWKATHFYSSVIRLILLGTTMHFIINALKGQ